MDKKNEFELILPEGMILPEGVHLPAIETETATIRKTIIREDGKMIEIEETIQVPKLEKND